MRCGYSCSWWRSSFLVPNEKKPGMCHSGSSSEPDVSELVLNLAVSLTAVYPSKLATTVQHLVPSTSCSEFETNHREIFDGTNHCCCTDSPSTSSSLGSHNTNFSANLRFHSDIFHYFSIAQNHPRTRITISTCLTPVNEFSDLLQF